MREAGMCINVEQDTGTINGRPVNLPTSTLFLACPEVLFGLHKSCFCHPGGSPIKCARGPISSMRAMSIWIPLLFKPSHRENRSIARVVHGMVHAFLVRTQTTKSMGCHQLPYEVPREPHGLGSTPETVQGSKMFSLLFDDFESRVHALGGLLVARTKASSHIRAQKSMCPVNCTRWFSWCLCTHLPIVSLGGYDAWIRTKTVQDSSPTIPRM